MLFLVINLIKNYMLNRGGYFKFCMLLFLLGVALGELCGRDVSVVLLFSFILLTIIIRLNWRRISGFLRNVFGMFDCGSGYFLLFCSCFYCGRIGSFDICKYSVGRR